MKDLKTNSDIPVGSDKHSHKMKQKSLIADNRSRGGVPSNYLANIDAMKFLLILGVVLIHCSPQGIYPALLNEEYPIIAACEFISARVCSVSVPCFFFLSAFLFFHRVESFGVKEYTFKLRRRFRTLLVPYLLWCAICCALLAVKHYLFHMTGLGIFLDNGNVDVSNLVKGFWYISEDGGYPYAFAFWFIRNLMVFCLLSPIVYLVARSGLLTLCFMTLYVATDIEFQGVEWFVLGAYYSLHYKSIRLNKIHATTLTVCGIAMFVLCLWLENIATYLPLLRVLAVCRVISALYLTFVTAKIAVTNRLIQKIIPSTFMIYATHQCYCTALRKIYASTMGELPYFGPGVAYVACFITFVLVGYLMYTLLDHNMPKLLALLTGGRAKQLNSCLKCQ